MKFGSSASWQKAIFEDSFRRVGRPLELEMLFCLHWTKVVPTCFGKEVDEVLCLSCSVQDKLDIVSLFQDLWCWDDLICLPYEPSKEKQPQSPKCHKANSSSRKTQIIKPSIRLSSTMHRWSKRILPLWEVDLHLQVDWGSGRGGGQPCSKRQSFNPQRISKIAKRKASGFVGPWEQFPQLLFGLLIQGESHALQIVIRSLLQILQELVIALLISHKNETKQSLGNHFSHPISFQNNTSGTLLGPGRDWRTCIGVLVPQTSLGVWPFNIVVALIKSPEVSTASWCPRTTSCLGTSRSRRTQCLQY